MTQYIIRRLLQAIPLLFFISLVLFSLLQTIGDPIATMGGRQVTRSSDRERLSCQFGLDKPIIIQYVYWLAGNDWAAPRDCDKDGEADRVEPRLGALRGDFGRSIVNRGKPALEVIWDRVPNTLILMGASELVIIFGALLLGVYS